MDTKERRPTQWPLLPGFLLLLACFGSLCAGQTDKKTANEYATRSGHLSCYVCNNLLESCDEVVSSQKVKCKDEYFNLVYGADGNTNDPLDKWPIALSELADKNKTGGGGGNGSTTPPGGRSEVSAKAGWVLGSFPSGYEGKGWDSTDATHRFSSLGIVHDNNDKKNTFTLDNGFQSCQVTRISVDSQLNGNQRGEIQKSHPRIIRTCSFVDASSKTGKDSFDEKGCRIFNYKAAAVEVCYCKGDGCNGSSYLQVSLWMIAASTLGLLAQNF